MAKYRIWYGKYGNREKTVTAKDSNDVHKKYSKLDLHQIVKLKPKRRK